MKTCSCSPSVSDSLQPMDCNMRGSSVHGTFQSRILELPFPTPRDLSNPGIQAMSLESPALAGGFFFYHSATWETQWSECTMPKCYILQVFTVHKCSTFCVFVKNSKKCDMENGIRLICLYMQNHVYSSNSFFQSFT